MTLEVGTLEAGTLAEYEPLRRLGSGTTISIALPACEEACRFRVDGSRVTVVAQECGAVLASGEGAGLLSAGAGIGKIAVPDASEGGIGTGRSACISSLEGASVITGNRAGSF